MQFSAYRKREHLDIPVLKRNLTYSIDEAYSHQELDGIAEKLTQVNILQLVMKWMLLMNVDKNQGRVLRNIYCEIYNWAPPKLWGWRGAGWRGADLTVEIYYAR